MSIIQRFTLQWPGKEESLQSLKGPGTGYLETVPEESLFGEQSPHLFLEGDNLGILRLLTKEYRKNIDIIYIDPPYNTGQTIAFDDHFYHQIPASFFPGENQIGTTSRTVRDPSPWLSMMFPRMILAHDLLKEDGAIFISIDDHAVHHLRCLLDEVFGPENHVGTVVWRKKVVRGRGHRHIIPQTEYIVVYARNIKLLPAFSEPLTREMVSAYTQQDEEGPYKLIPFAKSGTRHSPRPNLVYSITAPDGSLIDCPTHQWRWCEQTFLNRQSEILFRKNKKGGWSVFTKQRLYPDGRLRRKTPISYYDRVTTTDGTKELREWSGGAVFDFPKPSRLIRDLIGWIPSFSEKGDGIVLDFFGGTCPTAQAVIDLNQKDGGRRRFIVVQDIPLPERSDIASYGKERIRNVIGKYRKTDSPIPRDGEFLNLSFRVQRFVP
ncbi:MAG: site-specific DNA-methyltransferase [Leptospirales bacterium]